MNIARFEHLLERTMGLNSASIGVSAIERALDVRMRACAAESDDTYWDLLDRSRDELQQLIEAVIVPETWFFRDPQAFTALADAACEFWRKGLGRPLRLLSLPCSTGEEAYTMAMALLGAGLPPAAFRIDAIDISAHSLERARAGVYGRNSFRSKDLGFRDRHFAEVEKGFRINDAVRAPVRFGQGNILDPDFAPSANSYDIVFCRNLLIYFDVPTQAKAIAVLARALTSEGMLFVGHSEAGLMAVNGFASARVPMAFAFRKAAAPAAAPATAPPPTPVALRSTRRPRPPGAAKAAPRLARPVAAITAPSPPADRGLQSIEELRRIADCGRLDEAGRGAESHLRDRGPSSDVFLLLGLISDARGDSAAALRFYRKVLYLEPANPEALGHLALLLKKQGDHAGAQLLDERLRRQRERTSR